MTQPRLLGDRYELDGVVGRGGMAEVYRARDLRLDRIVAVKTLREDLARDQTFQARFRREAQSAASLNHPSIVAVYDTGEDTSPTSHTPYIVMEYVEGRTLRDLLRDDRRLLPERALEITDGVLRALDYSHRNNIIHRDIKPGNVMLMRSGDVKVMDFGIARAINDSQATMTQTAQVIGTAQYLSPEQARGERVDARSDLYSTGCLLYELLTGRPPFLGDSPVAIAYQHVRENPLPPSRLDPEIPAWADAIVLKAMAKDPGQRYQSANDMRTDIQRALSGVPVAAPRTAAYGPGPGTRRMDQGAGQTVATQGYRYGDRRPYDDYDDYGDYGDGPGGRGGRDNRGRDRRMALWWGIGALAVVAIIGGLAYAVLGGGSGQKSVPDVVGWRLKAADTAISNAGLTPVNQPKHSSSVPKGEVISTNPSGGLRKPAGYQVTVTWSTGPSTPQSVTVPDVIGQSQSAAAAQLRQDHFSVNAVPDPRSTQPQGTVVRQTPQGNTPARYGAQVTIYVSGGGVQVPNVVLDTQAQAIAAIQAAGLIPNPITMAAQTAGMLPGAVWRETPSASQVVQPGSTVTIYIEPAAQPSSTPSPSSSPTASPTASPSPTP